MTAIDDLRTVVSANRGGRSALTAAALGDPVALEAVRLQVSHESLTLGKPVVSDVCLLIESLAAGDRNALAETVRRWPTPDDTDSSPWFDAAWVAALRHLDPKQARAAAIGSRLLADEILLVARAGTDPIDRGDPISLTDIATGGALPIDWTTRPLANRPLVENLVTADALNRIATGWLRVLRGRFDLLADDTIEVFRARLGVDAPDAHDIALIIEASRAKEFDLDDTIAERISVWTDRGRRPFDQFEAILTLFTRWVVP